MTRTTLLLALGSVAVAAGCQGFDRPRDNRYKPRPEVPLAGEARVPIGEQLARGRDKYAMPQDDAQISPYVPFSRPSPTGR